MRVEDDRATNARVTREALERFADGESDRVVNAARVLVLAASDQGLCKLRRMLR